MDSVITLVLGLCVGTMMSGTYTLNYAYKKFQEYERYNMTNYAVEIAEQISGALAALKAENDDLILGVITNVKTVTGQDNRCNIIYPAEYGDLVMTLLNREIAKRRITLESLEVYSI